MCCAPLTLRRACGCRYAPSPRLAFSDDVAVPSLVSDFGEKLRLISAHATDRASSLKMASAKKGLANEHKRSMGKQVMMRKLGLIAERQAEEAALLAVAPQAGAPLARLGEIYDALRAAEALSSGLELLRGIYHGSTLLAAGQAIYEASVEAAKPDGEREVTYRARNLPFLVKRLQKRLADLHPPLEAALIRRAVASASKLPLGLLPADCEQLLSLASALEAGGGNGGEAAAAKLCGLQGLTAEQLTELLGGSAPLPSGDVAIACAKATYQAYVSDRDATKALLSERDQLLAALLEIQKVRERPRLRAPHTPRPRMRAHALPPRMHPTGPLGRRGLLPRRQRLPAPLGGTRGGLQRRGRGGPHAAHEPRGARRQAPRGPSERWAGHRPDHGRERLCRAGAPRRGLRRRPRHRGHARVHLLLYRYGRRQLRLARPRRRRQLPEPHAQCTAPSASSAQCTSQAAAFACVVQATLSRSTSIGSGSGS